MVPVQMGENGSAGLRIVSVDDHVIEPPNLWVDRLPRRFLDRAPRVERTWVTDVGFAKNNWTFNEDPSGGDGRPADAWIYEDSRRLLARGFCAVGQDRDALNFYPLSYEFDIPLGAYEQKARLEAMDRNHTEVSLCFPTIPRFCGQLFLEGNDKDLALACLRVYNDWMIDEWCGGAGRGRLVPVTLVPLWDAELAAGEVRRCAKKGSHAVTFSECPPFLGLPSLYSRYWDPFLQACEETDTVVNLHVGSSSKSASTADDMFHAVSSVLLWEYGMHAALDWIMSGTLERFRSVRIALSEVQAGWIPFVLERADNVWKNNAAIDQAIDGLRDVLPNPPSSYFAGRVYACIYDDLHGLECREQIGLEQILFETDYPHADSTWDHSLETALDLAKRAKMSDREVRQLLRENAITAFHLDRYFDVHHQVVSSDL